MSKMVYILIISIFVGLASGGMSSIFLSLLSFVTKIREAHSTFIWGLPFFGLFLGMIIRRIPHGINQGVPYILKELENDKAKVSVWMAPFIFLSSLGTHLFGGSAGREGVGVIMGASVAHILPLLKLSFHQMRPFLIYGGIAAGFSSIFGTPLAAIVFAFELHAFKHVKKIDLLLCTSLASFIALLIPSLLGIRHERFDVLFNLDRSIISYLLIAILASGIGGQIFYWGLKAYTRLMSFLFPILEIKLFMGGLLVALLVYFTDSYSYIGIGSELINQSFVSQMNPYDFMMKALLTVMTLAVGFKGGEVTPLFFMGGELFGWKVGVLCLISCSLARLLIGNRSVYRH